VSPRYYLKAAVRGAAVSFAHTLLFMVGMPLAVLSWAFETLGELLSYPAIWTSRESDRLSAWHKDAIRREIKGVRDE
jgi:hypothetical protein